MKTDGSLPDIQVTSRRIAWMTEQAHSMRAESEEDQKARIAAEMDFARNQLGCGAHGLGNLAAEDWSDEGLERLRQAVAEVPEERASGFLVVFFACVGFALGCIVTAAFLYLKAWGG